MAAHARPYSHTIRYIKPQGQNSINSLHWCETAWTSLPSEKLVTKASFFKSIPLHEKPTLSKDVFLLSQGLNRYLFLILWRKCCFDKYNYFIYDFLEHLKDVTIQKGFIQPAIDVFISKCYLIGLGDMIRKSLNTILVGQKNPHVSTIAERCSVMQTSMCYMYCSLFLCSWFPFALPKSCRVLKPKATTC